MVRLDQETLDELKAVRLMAIEHIESTSGMQRKFHKCNARIATYLFNHDIENSEKCLEKMGLILQEQHEWAEDLVKRDVMPENVYLQLTKSGMKVYNDYKYTVEDLKLSGNESE